jgi:hypothetical protein
MAPLKKGQIMKMMILITFRGGKEKASRSSKKIRPVLDDEDYDEEVFDYDVLSSDDQYDEETSGDDEE